MENIVENIVENKRELPNILVVEDDEAERVSLKASLETEGFIVEVAENGANAESIVKTVLFDIVIVDYRLPDIDGLNLIKKIKVISPDVIPVVVTAHSSVEIAVESMKMGAYDYIAKPLDISELTKTIYKIIEDRDTLFKSRKKLTEIVVTNNVNYSSFDEKITVIATPDTKLLVDDEIKISFSSKIKKFFSAIKNYYWGV